MFDVSLNLNTFKNWPELTLFITVLGGFVCFVVREYQHRRLVRFDIVLSEILKEFRNFVSIANKLKINVNSMPLQFLLCRNSKELDNWLTNPAFELENVSIQLGMFFPKRNRKVFYRFNQIAQDFNSSIHLACNDTLSEKDKMDIYESARCKFNCEFRNSMALITNEMYQQLLGTWHKPILINRCKQKIKCFKRGRNKKMRVLNGSLEANCLKQDERIESLISTIIIMQESIDFNNQTIATIKERIKQLENQLNSK